MTTDPKYIIGWHSKLTNTEGHGSLAMPLEECQSVCDSYNLEYPDITHFPVKETRKQCMMIKIVLREEGTQGYVGEYHSSIVPSINEIVSTPYNNYQVVGVQHDLSHNFVVIPELTNVTLYVRNIT